MPVVQPIADIFRDFPEVEVEYLDILDTWTYRRGARGENNEIDCFGVAMEMYRRAGLLIPDPVTLAGSIPEFLELFDEVTVPDKLYDLVNVLREENHVSVIVRQGLALTARHGSGVYTQRTQALQRLPNVRFYRLKPTALPPTQKSTTGLIPVDWIASTLAGTRRHGTVGIFTVDWTSIDASAANTGEMPTAGLVLVDWTALTPSGGLEESSSTQSLTFEIIALDPSGALAAVSETAGVIQVDWTALTPSGGLEESEDLTPSVFSFVALAPAASTGHSSTAGSPFLELTPLTPQAALTVLSGTAGIPTLEWTALDATALAGATLLATLDWTALDATGAEDQTASTAGIAAFDLDADRLMYGSNRHTTVGLITTEFTALDATAANTSGSSTLLAGLDWNALDATGSI